MLRLAFVCLCACGRVGFDSAELVSPDGPPPEPLFNGGFANPVSLGVDGSDPQLTRSGLELWTSFQNPTTYELRHARRGGVTDPFPEPAVVAIDSSESETDPSLTPDGTEIFFISSRDGEPKVYTAARAMESDEFATASVVAELQDSGTFSATLVGDNVLYLISGAGMFRTERAGSGTVFSDPVKVEAPVFGWPTISDDELELFGNVDPSIEIAINYATRRSKDEPFTLVNKLQFDAPCNTDFLGDPQLTNNGHSLVLRCGGDIVVMSR